MRLIAPSVLSADFGHLAEELAMINRSEADWRDGWYVCAEYIVRFSADEAIQAVLHEASGRAPDDHASGEIRGAFLRRRCLVRWFSSGGGGGSDAYSGDDQGKRCPDLSDNQSGY